MHSSDASGDGSASHVPVLLYETIDGLALCPGDIFFDGTLGGGGHSREACLRFGSRIKIIGSDKDEDAILRATQSLAPLHCDFTAIEASFGDVAKIMQRAGVARIDKALLDLGISSYQLDASGRGFSFLRDEPLLMTMQKHPSESDVTASDVVNAWGEESIESILRGYGEERYARRIARAIVAARASAPIRTTGDLARIITEAVPGAYRQGRIHPATRTFQAIRIAVNAELERLPSDVSALWKALAAGGRLAVISFHSLEDRIIKRFFRDMAQRGEGILLTKKPIVPSAEEIRNNPRSRSAKLRIIQKAG